MSKLVKHYIWAKRHFEPGSEPTKKMITWAIENGQLKGQIIADTPFVNDDALAAVAAKPEKDSGFNGSGYFGIKANA